MADRIVRGHGASAMPATRDALAAALREAREYTLRLYAHLAPAQRGFPLLDIVNPPDWELGHVGWFQEFWCCRWRRDDPAAARTRSCLPAADALYDSRAVPHDTRWHLRLPGWEATHDYLAATLARTLERLPALADADLALAQMALWHEDMHGEALLMTLHTLALPAPPGFEEAASGKPLEGPGGDIALAGGPVAVGTDERADGRYVFDNERRAHTVTLSPYAIGRQPVTAGEFAAFVDAGGYRDPRWWSAAGSAWLAGAGRLHPAAWRRAERTQGWEVRCFDRWLPLPSDAAVAHVSRFEAEAWCRWAGRRLPSEAEWEHAARLGAIPVHGSAWEWTASAFGPYPGFVPGEYAEYSQPWFGDHAVIRGGSWATRPRLPDAAFRNFYRPQRHDPFVGFRSCAARSPA